ncbi:MAG: PGF-CTERM-anchored ABC transporter substrate-binding protein [Halodesulfurarchaeum sp.]
MRYRVLLVITVLVVSLSGGGTATAVTGSAGIDTHTTDVSGAEATTTPSWNTSSCSFPITVSDATGRNVTISEEPDRIVTLAPSAAQTMWEIGAKEKVIGLSKHASYLAGADSRTVVSASGDSFVSVETVYSLQPDLVLAPDIVSNETVERLRELGLTVYKFEQPHSIEGIQSKTLLTGRLVGACSGARETVTWMNSRLATVREATKDTDRPRTLYVFFGYVAGSNTFIHDVIRTAGGTNVAARANNTGFYQISEEIVVTADPQWIVVNDGATQIPNSAAYNRTTAVKKGHIVVLDEEHISQPAPRIVHAVVNLTKALHPVAYRQAANVTHTQSTAPADTTTTTTAATPAPTDTVSSPSPTTTSSTPGFGIVGAIIGVVVAILVATREYH